MSGHKIASTPVYGQKQLGLFATSKIHAGQVIRSEKPLLSLRSATTPAAVTKVHTDFFDAISALQDADLSRLKNLSFRCNNFQHTPEIESFSHLARPAAGTTEAFELLVLRTFFAYSIPFAPEDDAEVHRLCRELCFLNHSCRPNASLDWVEDVGKVVLRATSDIDDGDEILVSYLPDPFKARADRHKELAFECKCIACSSENPEVEEAYLDISASIRLPDHVRNQLLHRPFPDDFRKADWAQIRAIAKFAGKENVQSAAARVRIGAEKLSIRHVKLAEVFEIDSAASLAWHLTHQNEKDIDLFLGAAIKAKAREMSMLCFCLGLASERAKKAQRQVWWMVQVYEKPVEVFCKVVSVAGMAAEVVGGDILLRFPLGGDHEGEDEGA